jgi:hypothetical protein
MYQEERLGNDDKVHLGQPTPTCSVKQINIVSQKNCIFARELWGAVKFSRTEKD